MMQIRNGRIAFSYGGSELPGYQAVVAAGF